MCRCVVCQSYLVCQADVFDERPVTVHLAGGQLLPRGPALLQHPHLRDLGFDEETDRACRGVSLTPRRLMTPKNLCPASKFGAFVCPVVFPTSRLLRQVAGDDLTDAGGDGRRRDDRIGPLSRAVIGVKQGFLQLLQSQQLHSDINVSES